MSSVATVESDTAVCVSDESGGGVGPSSLES